jgi:carboxylesterase type B
LEAIARVTGDAQFICEARRLARAIEVTGTRTYLYSYEYEIDALAVDHVIHGVESNILFGNPYVPPVFMPHTLDAADLGLHNAISGYWTRFASTGNPNTDDETVVRWPEFKHPSAPGRAADKFIVFDAVIGEGKRPRERACDFFEPFFLRSLLGAVPAGTP